MKFSIFAATSLALLISGCALTVSVSDLRTVNEGSTVVETRKSYEETYRIIASESRRCFERTLPGAMVSVRADLYSESKKGEVSIAGALMTSSITEILFEIRSIDANNSEIKTFYRKKSSESVERAMRIWLEGNTTVCRIERT